MRYIIWGAPGSGSGIVEAACAELEARIAGPYLLASGFSATDLYITKLAVWQDESFRRTELPRVHALTEAVRARPKLATVWARHIR